MSAVIEIPSALQRFVENQRKVAVEGDTIQHAFEDLVGKFSALQQQIYDEKGQIRSFINIYVNDEDIRYGKYLETELKPGDVIQIVPSIAGGR